VSVLGTTTKRGQRSPRVGVKPPDSTADTSNMSASDFEENPPDPVATIESLGSLGYSPESAVADLVDNSIAAGAQGIDIVFRWVDSKSSWCAVIDDGRGMDEASLKSAMKIGSADPLLQRSSDDLGRFGFGLKTASFSQCRELTVWTHRDTGRASSRCWDLDHVRKTHRWEMHKAAPTDAVPIIRKLGPKRPGTLVLWRRLTSILSDVVDADEKEIRTSFYERIAAVERHLAMTFARFLSRRTNGVIIRVNGNSLKPWDPFLKGNPATQSFPIERVKLGASMVTISAYVLPHESKLDSQAFQEAAGPLGWNAQQGFYVYRQDRLIVPGGWLGLPRLAPDDVHNLARIAVDVPATLDREWHLDVRKMSVRPPLTLRPKLLSIATATRSRAKAVYRTRAVEVKKGNVKPNLVPVWKQVKRHGELWFVINRDHPVVMEVLERIDGPKSTGRSFLQLLEETLPGPNLPTHAKSETASPLSDSAESLLRSMAEAVYARYLSSMTREEARRRLELTEPFDQHLDVIKEITGAS
jgi:hypothetical protein